MFPLSTVMKARCNVPRGPYKAATPETGTTTNLGDLQTNLNENMAPIILFKATSRKP